VKTWLFFLITTPILIFISINYRDWYFGEPIVNTFIWLYLYIGTWVSIGGSVKKFNKYFGKEGLYIPEEAIAYRWSTQIGNFYIKVLPKGKLDG
jgi:hypothetical protein